MSDKAVAQDIQDAARNQDHRPPRDGWAPGSYLCICGRCGDTFFGDKRAMECAPCAYREKPEPGSAS